jgi:hypothetical protein
MSKILTAYSVGAWLQVGEELQMSMIIPILVLVLGQGAAGAAQTPQTPQAQAPPPTCSAPEHQQFDF